MPNITYDGQSFSIDGRRVWLVSGAIHYPRVPRGLWRDRIRAAKQAGLNCVETYVFWNAHERQPGKFDFTGDLDLRAFVEMVAEEGMFAIVRPGPFVCAEWDFGGLPAWLHRDGRDPKTGTFRIRQKDPAFLEATSRYLRAVMKQIKDLQVTSPREGKRLPTPAGNVPGEPAGGFHDGWRSVCGGPIILMQAENEWFCHNPDEGHDYNLEIVRYLRENGCAVPIIACNQLWQTVAGTIQTWNSSANLPTDMRQLAAVQPDVPRLVSEYWPGWFDHWGGKHADTVDAGKHLYRLAGILGAGAQFNIFMFHGGTNFGFWGGRTVTGKDCYMTTSYDYDAPLLEAGGRAEKYAATKRICTFASQFAGVFAHLDPTPQHAAINQSETDHGLSIVHQPGGQGDVLFVLRAEKDKRDTAEVMLPNGLTLPIHLGDDRAAWTLLNANLGGAGTLDFTNLRPFALLDRKLLVLFGPAGTDGVISINESIAHVTVPKGMEPVVEQIEDLQVAVLNEQQIDAAYLTADGVVVGAQKLDEQGQPTPAQGWSKPTRITLSGATERLSLTAPKAPRPPRLGAWSAAETAAYLDGSADAYREIDGPASLEALGCDYGYGWYHLGLPSNAVSGNGRLLAPGGGDRLNLFQGDKLLAVMGPAGDDEPLNLKPAGEGLAILADNLGRMNYGQHVGSDIKGLPHHLVQVKTIRLRKPKTVDEPAPDPFELTDFIYSRRKGDIRTAQSYTWTIRPESRRPVVLDIQGLDDPAVLVINDQPYDIYNAGAHAKFKRWWLDPADDGPFTGGNNVVKLALLRPPSKAGQVEKCVKAYQVTNVVSNRTKWQFASWAMPGDDAFAAEAPAKTLGKPTWYRAAFNANSTDAPLFFDARGLSKGQIFLNDHNVGRYFVADEKAKHKGPQRLYYLPEPWLNTDGQNTLTVFDEYGHPPAKTRLLYRPLGPWH